MSDAKGIDVLAICGSLRAGSYNQAALRTAIELKPPGMTIETADIGSFPLYNEDVLARGYPPPVETLRRQIAEADALLFVTPEYNYSIPGVLKNAIDWASRPPDQPFAGKPVAMMGASPGMGGTGACAIRSAALLRLSRHAPAEQAGGVYRPGPYQVRRRRPLHRRGRTRAHSRSARRPRGMDPIDRPQELTSGGTPWIWTSPARSR